MKRIFIIAVTSLLMSSPVLAQSKTDDFVKQVANSDMTEISAAKIALQKGNAEEKKFARQMITDHTKTSKQLKALVAHKVVAATFPTALDSSSQNAIDTLNSSAAADFPAAYDPMQVSAHKDAVALFQDYSENGDNPKLKLWAAKTLPALKHHLQMAQSLEHAPAPTK